MSYLFIHMSISIANTLSETRNYNTVFLGPEGSTGRRGFVEQRNRWGVDFAWAAARLLPVTVLNAPQVAGKKY